MTYYSQIGQDRYYIEQISKKKHGGRFLDIGAHDGIHTSNTATLELEYGWSGICIEANPILSTKLKQNRPGSVVVNCAAWSENGYVELEIPKNNLQGIQGDLLSRISTLENNENYFPGHFASDTEKIMIPSRNINDLVEEYFEFPCVIDFMSLDIEGAEIEVLQSMNFDLLDIRFMTIEWGYRPGYVPLIQKILEPVGYQLHRVNEFDVEFSKINR